ncbi:hypothetical protein [Mucilaginibacter terrenus]|uniref:hypothetical protein n=1 Tax=Mucilaginibacter terrenus TaxID=2482727 RepID=UPI001058BA1E|nr:hypothetical protein [Mucilaginibacter terrenus]
MKPVSAFKPRPRSRLYRVMAALIFLSLAGLFILPLLLLLLVNALAAPISVAFPNLNVNKEHIPALRLKI